MATPNDLLSQAIAASQKQIQTNAANAQDMIRAAMAGGYADAARSDAGIPRQGNAPAAVPTNMDDIRGMYFSTMGNQAYTRDRTSQRTNAQGINDTALSIANGAIQSTLGLGALGLGLLNNRAGEWAANGLDAINNGVMGLQSDGLNNRRRANAASGEQITAYNKQRYDEDVKTDGSFLAGLKRIGRDGYGAVSNALSDGTIAGDGLANGLGSLLSAGPLAKGLGTIGKAVLRGAREAGLLGEAGAATAMRLGQKASMPVTIGAQESGGTYQQTYVEALRQLESRTDLTADQKRSMANSAALEAAAIQFPTAAATGAIVGQFERMPFRVPNVASGAGNLLKETIEEAIQGGTSQFATNRAIKDNVNSDQDLLDGIGEQVGLGGLYGLGAAGVVQAPGMAARTGLLAARAGINLGAQAVKGTIGAVTNAVDARLGQIDTSIEAKSPTSSQRLSAVNEKLNAEAPVRAEAVAQAVATNPTMAPEVKQQVMDNFDVVQQAFAVNPVEVESAPDNLKPIFDGAKNRFDTFQNASKIIQDKALDPMVRAKAAQYLLNGLTTIEDRINEVIAPFDDNDPVMDVVNGYLDQVNQINSNNNVRAAVQELVPIIQSFTAEQVQNDKDAAQTVADISGDNVGSVDPEVAKAIFYHADNGDIILKPQVRESLEMVVAADEAHKASQFSPIVNTDRHRVTGEISDNPGANAQGQLSIKGHISKIQSALRKGDFGAAEMQARDLVRFSDHMQNKVAALNESWDIVPGGEKPNAVPFEAYNPKTKLGYKAKAFLNPRSNSSIELGNIIGMNAQEVGTVAQIIAKAHPEWNLNPKPVVPLRQEARQAQAEIFERSTASEKAARRQAEAALTPEQTVASTKRNSDPAPKAAPVTAESVVRESETARTDPSAVVRTSVRQSEDQAKPVSQQTNPVTKTGQSEAAPQSQEVSEDAPASQEPDARKQPTKAAEEEVQVVPQQQTEEVETDQAEASKEPSVIAAPNDRFDAAFGKPNPKRSRVADKANVVEWVRDALSDADAFARATDATKKSAKLTKETASAYAGMLSGVPRIIAAMNQQLLEKSETEQGTGEKGVKVPFIEALKSDRGNAILMYDENRALGILKENADGKLEYDPRLVEQAVLAGIQWAIEGNAREGLLSAEKLDSILNMNEAQAQNYLAQFNEGIPFGDGASRLGNLIKNFWGVTSAKDVGVGLSNGIAEGVAKEVMRALDKVGLVHIPEPIVINNKNYSQVQFTLTKSVTEKMAKAMGEKGIEEAQRFIADLNGYPNAISDLVLTENVPTYSVGEPIKSNQTMQLRSSFAYLTAEQKQLIANEEASPRYPNAPLMNIYEAMGPTGAVALFGEPDVANMNKRHQESVESRNKQLRSAHEVLVNTKAQTTAYAEQQDGEGADYSTVPVYFPFTITASNRLQMESRFNPQSSKLVRDALPPTWSNIDMTDPKSYQGFMLGMAQALGVKLNKARLAQNIAKAEDILARPGYQEVVNIIRGMLGASTSEVALSFTPEMAKRIRGLLDPKGKALEPVQFGALVEYARYLEAKEEGDEALKDFNTMAFVEADGITDGPGNAIKHFEAGNFTLEWADNMARTGGFVGRQGMTINEFNVQDVAANNRRDTLDLYGKMSGRLDAFVRKQHSKIIAQVGGEQIKAIQTLLYTLLPNQVKLVNGTLIFDRNFVKNPLTVDTYGSGAKGIAGKIVNDLATALYENETKLLRAQAEQGDAFDPAKAMFGDVPNAQEKYDAFRAAMKTASNTYINRDEFGRFIVSKPEGRIFRGSHLDPNFSLEEGALEALTNNIQHIYVTPMIEAMNTVMGPAKDTISTIRSLSQIHSSALGYVFFSKINEIVKGKTKAYKEGGEYFSSNMYATPNEIDSVMKSLAPLQPTLRTGTQQIAYAGNERAKTGVSYSRSLDRQNATDGLIPALTQAGVRVVALFTQAIGDGQMIQNIWPSPMACVNRAIGDGQMIQNIGTMKGAPQGTEKVFDGVHLKISTLTEDGAKVNQAVYDAWMRTPVTDMLNSIKLFRDNMNWDFLQKDSFTLNKKNPDPRVIDLMKTFASLIWSDNYKRWGAIRDIEQGNMAPLGTENLKGLEATIKKMALPTLDSLIRDLERRAGEIEIRNDVIKMFGMSVDHMAGAESAYTVKGEVDTTGMTDKQIVEAMQAEYEKRHAERFPPVVPEKHNSPLYPSFIVRPSGFTGVSVMDADSLVAGIRNKVTKDQRPLMTAALKVLRDNPGWNVLVGSREDLRAYAKDQGGMVPEGSFLGATVPSEKRIYVVEGAGIETILHEVLHATTMDKLIRHYDDPSQSSPEMTETVNRLEGLMTDWMDATEDTSSLKQATQDAVLNAKRQILSALENGDQVRALNEFMAWNLSNKDLVRLNQGILAKLGQITKAALIAIKKLIFGSQQAIGVSDSVFDNLRFNTMAIMLNDQATLNNNPVEPVMFNMQVDEEEESALSKGIHDTIVRLYRAYDKTAPKFEDGTDGNRAWNEAQMDLIDGEAMAATMAANGYPMGPEEHSNFVRISALMQSEFAPANAMLNQSQKLFEQFLANVTVDDFVKMGNDPLVAQKKLDLLTGKIEQANKKDRKGLSSLMPNFFALAASNLEFQKELRQIALDEKEVDTAGTIDAKLTNFGNDLMAKADQMYSGLDGKETNMSEAMQKLVAAMFMSDASANSWLGMLEKAANAGDSVIERFDRMGTKYMGQAGEAAYAKGQKMIENANGSKVLELLGQGLSAAGGIMDPANAEKMGEDAMRVLHGMGVMRPLKEMLAEMVGRTQSNKGQFDLIKKIRQVVDTLRQEYREYLPDAFAKQFSRVLTNQEWNQLHKLGAVDTAALVDHIGMPALIKMMKSGFSGLTGDINKAEREVIKAGGSQDMLDLATNLARFMNGLDHQEALVRNAYAIAFLSNGNQEPDTKLVDAIDKLVSLRALDSMSQEDQSFLTEMAKTEEKGVTSLISYMKGQRNKENKQALSTEQKLNMFKGYVPTTPKEGVSVELHNDARYAELAKLGYTRVGDFDKTLGKAFGGSFGYYISNTGLKGSYLQGTMRTVHDTVGGINAVTLQNTQPTAAVATDPTDVYNIGRMNEIAQTMGSKYLAQPIFNRNGEVIRYEFPLPADMRAMLKEDRHLGKAIGQWAGRQVEEELAHLMNEAVVEEAEKAYRAGPRGDFINLFDPKEQKDPIIKDSMSLVPFAMRDLLEEKFGPNQFWVHRDMVNNLVGYRKATVRDMFTENTRANEETQTFVKNTATLFFGAKAFEYLAKGEDAIKKGVSQAKQTIVIRSIVVPMANFAAAMLQLRATGVRTSSILKGMPAKLNEAHIYTKGLLKRMDLRLQAQVADGEGNTTKAAAINKQIEVLEDGWRRLSIWPLLEAGELSSISDGALSKEDVELTDGRFAEYIEKLTDKMPDGLKTIAKYGLVTKDTALYKGLTRSVQFGDFVAKAVLYDHRIAEGKTPEQALGEVTEAFVNFEYQPGRTASYWDEMGLRWFWHFKLRSAKFALSMVRNTPVSALMSTFMPTVPLLGNIGTPVNDSIISQVFDGRAARSLGWATGMRSFFLNPWVNLVH